MPLRRDAAAALPAVQPAPARRAWAAGPAGPGGRGRRPAPRSRRPASRPVPAPGTAAPAAARPGGPVKSIRPDRAHARLRSCCVPREQRAWLSHAARAAARQVLALGVQVQARSPPSAGQRPGLAALADRVHQAPAQRLRGDRLPVKARNAARQRPMRRRRLTVPPAPGSARSRISGRPSRVSGPPPPGRRRPAARCPRPGTRRAGTRSSARPAGAAAVPGFGSAGSGARAPDRAGCRTRPDPRPRRSPARRPCSDHAQARSAAAPVSAAASASRIRQSTALRRAGRASVIRS